MCFMTIGLLTSAACAQSPAPAKTAYEEFFVKGEGDAPNGIYDPSIEYGPDKVGWMAYSAVTAGKTGRVHTHIAKTTDGGRTWQFVAAVNTSVEDTVQTGNGEAVKGAWWNEVSTLVHDPSDPGREWKLFWHKYFARYPTNNSNCRVLSHGWIAYRHAPAPAGPWSDEIRLFGAGPFPLEPFKAQINLSKLHPDLASYFAYTEPGSIAVDGALSLSLQAVRKPLFKKPIHDTILIRSRDHGKTWEYVGMLLRENDAKPFGGDNFTGSSLAAEQGRVFLMVCPSFQEDINPLTSHRGTVIFEFDDIATGKLKRSADGKLIVVKHLTPALAKGGQSDYDEQNVYGGIVMPQFDIGNLPRPWRIYNTRQTIVERPAERARTNHR